MPTKQKATAGQELALTELVYQEHAEFSAVTLKEFDHAKASCLQKPRNGTLAVVQIRKRWKLVPRSLISCPQMRRAGPSVLQSSQTPELARAPYPSCRPRSPPGVHWTRQERLHEARTPVIRVYRYQDPGDLVWSLRCWMKVIDDIMEDDQVEDLAKRDEGVATFQAITSVTEKEKHKRLITASSCLTRTWSSE